MAQCEGFYVRPEDMAETLATLTTPGPELAAVYEADDKTWPPGVHVAVYTGVGEPERAAFAFAVSIHDGAVVGIHLGCAMTPDAYADFFGLEEPIAP